MNECHQRQLNKLNEDHQYVIVIFNIDGHFHKMYEHAFSSVEAAEGIARGLESSLTYVVCKMTPESVVYWQSMVERVDIESSSTIENKRKVTV